MDKKKVASETKKKNQTQNVIDKGVRKATLSSYKRFLNLGTKILVAGWAAPQGTSSTSFHWDYLAANQTWGNREALILSSACVFFPSKHSFAIYSWNFSWHLELAEAEV